MCQVLIVPYILTTNVGRTVPWLVNRYIIVVYQVYILVASKYFATWMRDARVEVIAACFRAVDRASVAHQQAVGVQSI